MRTNFLSNTCRFIVNKSDYLPFVSTLTNLAYIFQKAVVLPIKQKESMPKSSYYSHLSQKSFGRCIILLLPVLGNIIVGIYDFAHRKSYNKNTGIEPTQYNNGPSIPANQLLKNDIKIDLTTKEQNDSDLEHTNEAPLFEKVFYQACLELVQKDGLVLKYTPTFRNHKEFVLTAVRQNGLALDYASQELQNDREVVLTAVQQNASAVRYASQELQNDPIIISLATSK
ncbi:hypothetical protein DB41_GZ00550 [Neochlamydia sp. TUME1]|uniref:DUF4116 domain-containing protein n=1 Tax=Neochlamydia sp. TUME1 TaxID=1478174 RepID=UPI00057FB4AD|nr:DUF4116 domain-containing protein [Neochlamydia sp. TUME1]KIC75891.1 hypothetical protein DB41_GZ00550 [Neochlamydia sp. TUME1]